MKRGDAIGITLVGLSEIIANRIPSALEMRHAFKVSLVGKFYAPTNQPSRPFSKRVKVTINLSLPFVRLKLVKAIGNWNLARTTVRG